MYLRRKVDVVLFLFDVSNFIAVKCLSSFSTAVDFTLEQQHPLQVMAWYITFARFGLIS